MIGGIAGSAAAIGALGLIAVTFARFSFGAPATDIDHLFRQRCFRHLDEKAKIIQLCLAIGDVMADVPLERVLCRD